MTEPREPREIFVLRLRPEKDCADAIRALRGALKTLLRQFRLRAIDVREERRK